MISEDDAEDYKQQAGEERWQAFLERRAMMGGPEAPEPCEKCDGEGVRCTHDQGWCLPTCDSGFSSDNECPRCLGTGVQP